jgi:hypothetical protein
VPSLNLDCGTGYPDREFLWFSSATPSEWLGNTLK